MGKDQQEEVAQFLHVAEVADWLRMSKRQVWTLRALGELPAVRFSNRVTRFTRAGVLDFIQRKMKGR